MITVKAPITIYQFDEDRYARIEQSIATIQVEVQSMREQLQEVLTNRQADIDAVTSELKKDVDAQNAATLADVQKPPTP
jgi:vacuolar-type H+-ATPase subunit I/STV1